MGGAERSDGGPAEFIEHVAPQQSVVLIHNALLELSLRDLQCLGIGPTQYY